MIADRSRPSTASGKSSGSAWPIAELAASPLAVAIQSFQARTRLAGSTTIRPVSRASRIAEETMLSGAGIWSRHPAGLALDELRQQPLQGGERRHVHEHGDIAADVPLAHREVDIEEHHHVALLGRRR